MTEKQETGLEIRVCIEKEGRDGPIFAFSRFGSDAGSYKSLPIYSKKALEAQIALLAKSVRGIMQMQGKDQVCFIYAHPELKEKAAEEWAELEELGISRHDPRDADVLFDMLRKHFPEAEYRK